MNADELEEALIAWGRLYGIFGQTYIEDRSPTGNSNLARHIGKPKKQDTVKRSGLSRRVMMARELLRKRVVGMDYCDPIPCVETRSYRPYFDPRETNSLDQLQNAWMDLFRRSEAQATAIRLHYQRRDLTREDKAKELGMTVHAYRQALRDGRDFLRMSPLLNS